MASNCIVFFSLKEMSQQWTQVQEMPVEFLSKLSSTYAEIFPIQIRDCFSVWIDEQPW